MFSATTHNVVILFFSDKRYQRKKKATITDSTEGELSSPHKSLIPEMIALKEVVHHSEFRKSQTGLERTNPVTWILITWKD